MIQEHASLHSRLDFIWIVVAAVGAALGARLVQLQLVENVDYRLAAERNRTQVIHQTAPRGRFFDRNGAVLAANQPAFSLIYLPTRGKESADLGLLARELAAQLNEKPQDLLETLQQAVREETAIRLAENLPAATMFRLSELKTIYPGVDLIVEARRYYPYGRFASHLIGYMGRMDQRRWKDLKSRGYRVDSRIGKTGLESVFEGELRGRDGGVRMEVDAQGRLKRVLERIAWAAGGDVHLTLDAAVQKAADEGLRRSPSGRGAVVVLDPRDGSILALASAPDFDPNAFLASDPEELKRHLADLPEFNLAISGLYAPGSAFKPVVGAAGLNEGRFRPEDAVYCPGHFELGRRIFLCWEAKGHKRMSWLSGLTHSCDVYFYQMGLKTGGALIERYARLFGLGSKTNVALKGEKPGNLFGPQARSRTRKSWYDGDTANLSIGQGELLVTPIQMAVMISALANRGALWRPHYTQRIAYADGRPDYVQGPEKLGEIALKDGTWDQLQEALRLVVSSGTGRAALISGLDVRGKTGTAQNPAGEDHAWFVAYAARPGEPPSAAAAILVENGGHGSSAAAPIARDVFLAAFGLAGGSPPSRASMGYEEARGLAGRPAAAVPAAAGVPASAPHRPGPSGLRPAGVR